MTSHYLFPASRVSQPAVKETVLVGVLQVLGFLAVWMRFRSRRITRKKLAFNDHAILVALFFNISLVSIAILCT